MLSQKGICRFYNGEIYNITKKMDESFYNVEIHFKNENNSKRIKSLLEGQEGSPIINIINGNLVYKTDLVSDYGEEVYPNHNKNNIKSIEMEIRSIIDLYKDTFGDK